RAGGRHRHPRRGIPGRGPGRRCRPRGGPAGAGGRAGRGRGHPRPSAHAAAAGVDAIVDMVAVRRNRPQTFLAVNMESPRLVGEAAQANNVKKVVFVSAIGARPDPKYEYLVSRWAGEEALKRTGAPYVILRFSFILGEDGGVVDDFERAAHLGPIIVIPGSGEQHLQPIIREDAARCVVEAIGRADLYGQTLELGGPEILTHSPSQWATTHWRDRTVK